MLATMERFPDQDQSIPDVERDPAIFSSRRRTNDDNPLEGLFNLTRVMPQKDDDDDDDQFDVDMTILDFLAYKTTSLVFEWRSTSNPYQSDLPSALVTMTAEWRNLLKHRYDGRRLNEQAAFRSRLLQFVLLFTHRFNHDKTWTNEESLNDIRAQNKKRGQYWNQQALGSAALRNSFDTHKSFPLSDGALAQNRHELASSFGIPPDRRRWVTDLEGTPSLHCLLPLFIELTAARADLDDGWRPTQEWLHLAVEFMLQSVVEEYLLNGAFGNDPFNTIFAFGCPRLGAADGQGSDIQAMRSLFCDESDPTKQVHGWAKLRREYINELLPRPDTSESFLQAMQRAQSQHPYQRFEDQLLDFLKHLHDGLVKPDLVQVEEGRITIHGNELDEAESRAMIERMGL